MGLIGNAWKDIKNLPGGIANTAKTTVINPWEDFLSTGHVSPKHNRQIDRATEAAMAQYPQILAHPERSFENHPINTLMALGPLKVLRGEHAIIKTTEGASAREALVRAAVTRSQLSINEHGAGLVHPNKGLDAPVSTVSAAERAAEAARAQSTHAIRRSNEPTQFGSPHVEDTYRGRSTVSPEFTGKGLENYVPPKSTIKPAVAMTNKGGVYRQPDGTYSVHFHTGERIPNLTLAQAIERMKAGSGGPTGKGMERIGTAMFQDGERIPTDPAAYNKWQNNRAVEYYAKQPEYKPKPVVNEGPAGMGDLMGKRRELFDFSHEGRMAASDARHRAIPLEEMNLQTLLDQMEKAHARGNTNRGDEIANHIQQKHGFDPYDPSVPMPDDPEFGKFLDRRDKSRNSGVHDPNFDRATSHGYHSKQLLQMLMDHVGSPHWDAQSALDHLRNTEHDLYAGEGLGTKRMQAMHDYNQSAKEGPASRKAARRSYYRPRDSKARADALIQMMRDNHPSNN